MAPGTRVVVISRLSPNHGRQGVVTLRQSGALGSDSGWRLVLLDGEDLPHRFDLGNIVPLSDPAHLAGAE